MSEFYWTTRPDDRWTNGPHPTREAALDEGRRDEPRKVIHTAILRPANLDSMLPSGDQIIDQMRCDAGDQGDEDGDWLSNVSKDATGELEDYVRAAIKGWLTRIGEDPSFGLMEEIEAHEPIQA